MKLCLATLSLIEAAKNGRNGKHGKVDLDNDRFNWKIPKCITNEDVYCTSKSVLTENNQSIMFNEDTYKNMENHIYQIKAPEGYQVKLKFDVDHEFQLEYHNKCGYDKLHIFRGNLETFEQTNRIARFCGPKQNGKNGHSKPYDGANKVYETAGVLPMWDEEFNTGTNEVIVAVDFDQDNDGLRGFKLDYSFESVVPVPCPTFSDFQETAAWAHDEMIKATEELNWNPEFRNRAKRRMIGRIEYSRRALAKRTKKNPKCIKNWNDEVSSDMAATFSGFCNCDISGPNYLKDLFSEFTNLMDEYNGECSNMRHWNTRLGVLNKLADDGLEGQNNANSNNCEQEPVYTKPEGYTETKTEWGTVYTKLYSDQAYSFEAGRALCANDKIDDTIPHMPRPQDLNQNGFYYDIASQAGKDNDADVWLGIELHESGNWYGTNGERQTFFKWQMQNRKSNGNPHLKMNLSGTDRQNSKWVDSKHFLNMVLCTFTVPNSVPEPVPECGYGWEPVDLTEGRKCAQHNYYWYLHEEAVTHCEAQGARLAQPKNDEDNKALSDAYGYNQKTPDNQGLSIWLAATKADGTWKDVHDGSEITYFRWRRFQPDDDGNFIKLVLNEDTEWGNRNGVMSDKPSTAQSMFGFICVR